LTLDILLQTGTDFVFYGVKSCTVEFA